MFPINWPCTMFPLASFVLAWVGKNVETYDIQFLTPTSDPQYL